MIGIDLLKAYRDVVQKAIPTPIVRLIDTIKYLWILGRSLNGIYSSWRVGRWTSETITKARSLNGLPDMVRTILPFLSHRNSCFESKIHYTPGSMHLWWERMTLVDRGNVICRWYIFKHKNLSGGPLLLYLVALYWELLGENRIGRLYLLATASGTSNTPRCWEEIFRECIASPRRNHHLSFSEESLRWVSSYLGTCAVFSLKL